MLDHPHHYIGTILWGKMISARPAGIREKAVEKLEMGVDTERETCIVAREGLLENEKMNGMDWVEKFNLLEKMQYGLVIQ
jgi:hypothetical protein